MYWFYPASSRDSLMLEPSPCSALGQGVRSQDRAEGGGGFGPSLGHAVPDLPGLVVPLAARPVSCSLSHSCCSEALETWI